MNSDQKKRALRFANWRDALRTSTLPKAVSRDYEVVIFGFLRFCRESYAPATVALARQYLEKRPGREGERDAVSEQILHRPDIRPALQQVRRQAVPQHMRRHARDSA